MVALGEARNNLLSLAQHVGLFIESRGDDSSKERESVGRRIAQEI